MVSSHDPVSDRVSRDETDFEEVTSPQPAGSEPTLPKLGLTGGLRFVWAQLTSMRTALVLLFALALAAIPGSLVPQRPVSPVRVDEFLTDHPTLGPFYDTIGMFEVYSSPWFSAIYLLLFVSLIGCIIPRVGVYAKALRKAPPITPRNLSRLPAYAVGELDEQETVDEVLARAELSLRRRRYRVVNHGDSVSAERGYLREFGNLVFHLSLVVLLIGVALSSLFGYRGSSIVVVGQGFSNNLTQYDDIRAGDRFTETDLSPFTILVRNFDVKFETGEVQTGAARLFKLLVQVEEPGKKPTDKLIEVNHPITVAGDKVHMVGHGYAPIVTVTDGLGDVAFAGPVVFLPQDGNFTSVGVIKAPYAKPQRLYFQGFFLPTATIDDLGPRSLFPDAFNPGLVVTAWSGPPKANETGEPESVYALDTTGLTQVREANGQPVRRLLAPGESLKLPAGQGSLKFEGYQRWVNLQISHTPGIPLSIGAIGFAVAGLCLSLFVRPRRLWVRVRTGESGTAESGRTLVEVAGLDRADARAGLDEDVQELAEEVAPAPDVASPEPTSPVAIDDEQAGQQKEPVQ